MAAPSKSSFVKTPSVTIQSNPPSPDRILRCREVQERTGLSTSTLYDWMRRGIFPKPLQLGPRNVGWRESAITGWIDSRQSAR